MSALIAHEDIVASRLSFNVETSLSCLGHMFCSPFGKAADLDECAPPTLLLKSS